MHVVVPGEPEYLWVVVVESEHAIDGFLDPGSVHTV